MQGRTRVTLGRLEHKVLQATAMGHIHSGTHGREVERVIPAVTPSGWNSLQLSMAGPRSAVLALSSSGA